MIIVFKKIWNINHESLQKQQQHQQKQQQQQHIYIKSTLYISISIVHSILN